MPQISVIVPLYNKCRYVAETLESVLRQTFRDYELIIIDDGSTDRSGQIADEYAAQDERIRVMHISNSGVSHARNVGLDMAVGEYITFIDADDTVTTDYLEILYRCITENDVDIVISGVTKTSCRNGENRIIKAPYFEKINLLSILEDFAIVQKNTGIYGTCAGKIFNKSLCNGVFFDEGIKLAEDLDFYIRLFRKAQTVFFDDHALYFYLQDAENSSVRVDDSQIDYLSQALIQLRIRSFLQDYSVYRGENKAIISENITNYFYYSLHFADREHFVEVFRKLHDLYLSEGLDLQGKGFRKAVVISLLKKGRERMAFFFVFLWRAARRLLR